MEFNFAPPPLPITLIFCLQVYNFKVRNIFLRFWIACKVFFKKSQKNIINFNLCSRFTFVLVIVTKIFVFKSLKRLCSYMFICVHILHLQCSYNCMGNISSWDYSIFLYFQWITCIVLENKARIKKGMFLDSLESTSCTYM